VCVPGTITAGDDVVCTITNTKLPGATLLIIDEDSIDNDDEPFTTTPCYQYLNQTAFTISGFETTVGCGGFDDPLNTASPVNANLSLSPGSRMELPFFNDNPGRIMEIQVGHVTDEGWYIPQDIPDSWIETGPTDGGFRNYVGISDPIPGGPLVPGPGLGVGFEREELLDNIKDVIPIRYHGLLELIGKDICGVVHDSDISINYLPDPLGVDDANLQGNYKGLVAFRILQVIPFGDDSPFAQGQDPQEIAKVMIGILDAVNTQGTGVCQGTAFEIMETEQFIVDPINSIVEGELVDFDTGYNEPPTPLTPNDFIYP